MARRFEEFLFRIDHCSRFEERRSPRYRWNNAAWPDRHFVILQHTLAGSGIYETKVARREVGPGMAFLAIVPERSQYYYPAGAAEPWRFRWLNLKGGFSHAFWGAFRDEFGSVLPLDSASSAGRLLDGLFHLLDSTPAADPLMTSEQVYAFAMAWRRELLEVSARPRDPLREAVTFCERHCRLPIRVKEVADRVGLSREHLTRIFVERYGLGPAAYLRQLRLENARKLLDSTGHPLGEIARLTGFQDARQLRKWLRD